jgi:hypothetical protein
MIWLPPRRVTLALLFSVTPTQPVGGGPTVEQFVRVPLAEYVPVARAPDKFWAFAGRPNPTKIHAGNDTTAPARSGPLVLKL